MTLTPECIDTIVLTVSCGAIILGGVMIFVALVEKAVKGRDD